MWSTRGKVCTGKSYGTLPGDAEGKATEVERNTARTRREYENTSTFGMSDGSAEMMAKDLFVDALTDFDLRLILENNNRSPSHLMTRSIGRWDRSVL